MSTKKYAESIKDIIRSAETYETVVLNITLALDQIPDGEVKELIKYMYNMPYTYNKRQTKYYYYLVGCWCYPASHQRS